MAIKKMAVIGEGRMGSGIVQHIASLRNSGGYGWHF